MRYLPLTDGDRSAMLDTIGVSAIDDLFVDVPESARFDGAFDLPDHMAEFEVERRMAALASRNVTTGDVPSFLGAGAYRHHVPASVDHLVQRGEFLTSYTPYQPEISQGTLQALFEFQTMVALITGMDVANASMYDGATSCAEAVLMARRITRRNKAVISGSVHPHYSAVTETQAKYVDIEIDIREPDLDGGEDLAGAIDDGTACVVVQNPGVFGHVRDLSSLAEACHAAGALLVVVVTEAVSLGAVKSPGEMGADIVVAEGQSLGNPQGFGGPHVGLFATRDKYVRQMPGRLAGETEDADGRRGWVLTLSTREQHIRREKATSNICTNSGLCALAFTIHLSLLGEDGFRNLAMLNHARASQLADRLSALGGVEVLPDAFFNEFAVRLAKPAAGVVDTLATRGVLAGVPGARLFGAGNGVDDILLVAASELTREDDMQALCDGLSEVLA
ncbi:MAG: aminomethyl-transferring glycine dehydrogenase subunit GcvPA [Alphaproteobacteria bacterium]|nr:aminomethyl-transferring glycine dehydrogenase subunit GcvPA [Alphaproteobacteria bacterium]